MISNNEFDDWGQQSTAPQDENPDGNSGVDLMQVAMRRKGLIALGIFVGLCLGLLYYARATPIYESMALLSIDEKAPPMSTEFGRMYDVSPADDHAIRIKTARIIGDAMEENGGALADLPSLAGAENPIQVIHEGLEVQPIKDGSEVLTLTYRGTNPEDCQLILDSLMFSYRRFLDDGKKDIGAEMQTWISKARDDLKLQLDNKTKDLAEWKRTSQLFLLDDEGTNIHQQRQAQLESRRFDLERQRDELTTLLDLVQEGMARGTDPEVLLVFADSGFGIDDDAMSRVVETERIRVELQRETRDSERSIPLKMQVLDLEQRYGPDHPRRKAIERMIAMADQRYVEESEAAGDLTVTDDRTERAVERLNRFVQSIKERFTKGQKDLEKLNKEFVAERAKAELIAKDSAEYHARVDDIARTQSMFDAIVKRVADVDLMENWGGQDKVVIQTLQDPAPGLKVAPSLSKSLAAGTMLGFLAGFGLGYLVEMFDKTFRSPQEVSKILQLPMIGHIPEITCVKPEGSALSDVLVTAHKPKSPLAENFRAIRTALYFTASNQQASVIQTTSPVPGDGKSTLTANIAITIAQSNKSVLLIDADFRRPTQHKLFGVENDIGLSSVVTGESEPDAATQSTEVPNMYLMACGPRPHNPSELLTSPQFADLVEVLREQYDFVLIDTPPVLAVTDPGIVSARVDGVIMALRIRKNGRPSAIRARKVLHDLDANMIGIVVNGIDHRSGSYGYYSSYRRGYGYNYAYKYGYGTTQDKTEQAINKYFEEPKAEKSLES